MFTNLHTRRKVGVLSRLAAFTVMAALTICSVPSGSNAAPASTPLTVSFYTLRCVDDTVEANNDEPYVVFFVANLKPIGIAPSDAKRSTLFGDVDAGDERYEMKLDWSKNPPIIPTPKMLWGLNGSAAAIASPNDIIILGAMMENDSSSPDAVVSAVDGILAGKLQFYRASGFSRAKIVEKLITDMNGAIDGAIITGVIDKDERLGTAKEFPLTTAELDQARNGTPVFVTRTFYGDDAIYKVRIDIKKG